jgi:hypothetical protein
MNKNNIQNLISNDKRSPIEVRENGRKGGIASGKARREKKTFKELAEKLLDCGVKDAKLLKQLDQFGFKAGNGSMTVKQAMICGMAIQAIKGNPKAYEVIKETLEPKNEIIGNEIEDLTPLADLIRIDNDSKTND